MATRADTTYNVQFVGEEGLIEVKSFRSMAHFACLGCESYTLPMVVVAAKHSAVVACPPVLVRHLDFWQCNRFSMSKNGNTLTPHTPCNAKRGNLHTPAAVAGQPDTRWRERE